MLGIILAIAMTASLVVGCGAKEESATMPEAIEEVEESATKDSVIVAMGHGSEPEAGFDPAYGWGAGEHVHEPLIQSTLLKMTTDGTYANDLAKDYDISSDFKTYTVNLRDDVKFTDGTPLTAEDVAFTFEAAKESGASLDLSALNTVEAVDDYTVQFNLNKSDSTFLDKLAYIGIVPSDSYNNETYGENPVGSGPYKFVQWDKGQQVILEKNPDYYGKMPEVEKITILFAQNEAAFNLAKNGEADIVAVPLEYGKEKIDGYTMYLMDTIDVRGVSLPNVPDTGEVSPEDNYAIGNNVTGDPAVRQALAIGIDRQELLDGALNGYGNVSYTGVADQLPWAFDAGYKDGQVDQAKTILEQAGWKDTDGDGIREKDGQRAEFTVYYKASAVERQAIAVTLAEQAKDLGIEITPKGASWDEIDPDKYSQGVVWGFGSADPYSIEHQYGSDVACVGYDNPGNLKDSAVDALIDTAMAQPADASYSTWKQAAKQATSHNSFLWIGTMDYTYFVSDDLDISNSTHLIYPHGGDIWGNIYDWKRLETNETA